MDDVYFSCSAVAAALEERKAPICGEEEAPDDGEKCCIPLYLPAITS
jgi:hypothetical protein